MIGSSAIVDEGVVHYLGLVLYVGIVLLKIGSLNKIKVYFFNNNYSRKNIGQQKNRQLFTIKKIKRNQKCI